MAFLAGRPEHRYAGCQERQGTLCNDGLRADAEMADLNREIAAFDAVRADLER
jgi:hypothetical protein